MANDEAEFCLFLLLFDVDYVCADKVPSAVTDWLCYHAKWNSQFKSRLCFVRTIQLLFSNLTFFPFAASSTKTRRLCRCVCYLYFIFWFSIATVTIVWLFVIEKTTHNDWIISDELKRRVTAKMSSLWGNEQRIHQTLFKRPDER